MEEYVEKILYRRITKSDFRSIEGHGNKDKGKGGGQGYIDLSGIDGEYAAIVDFCKYGQKTLVGGDWPDLSIDCYEIGTEQEQRLDIATRTGSGIERNYRIRNQFQDRHPAWKTEAGFPAIPNQIKEIEDNDARWARMNQEIPSIIGNREKQNPSTLTVYVVRTTKRRYYAGYLFGLDLPDMWPNGIGLESMLAKNWQDQKKQNQGMYVPSVLLEFTNNKEEPFRLIQPFEEEEDDATYLQEAVFSGKEMVVGEYADRYKAKPLTQMSKDKEKLRRDPLVGRSVLHEAKFKCQVCASHSSFPSKTYSALRGVETSYMEPHHLIPVSNYKTYYEEYGVNLDCPQNIVCLCPNCHKLIHHGTKEKVREVLGILLDKKKSEFVEIGLEIDYEALCELYKAKQ